MSTDQDTNQKSKSRKKPSWARFRLKGPGVLIYSNQPIQLDESYIVSYNAEHKDYCSNLDSQYDCIELKVPAEIQFCTLQQLSHEAN